VVRFQSDQLGKPVKVLEGLAEGAFDKFLAGDSAGHDQEILNTATRIAKQVDIFVLAQASMSRMESKLFEVTGKLVLTSPGLGVLLITICASFRERIRQSSSCRDQLPGEFGQIKIEEG
jgi:hypothetical protein